MEYNMHQQMLPIPRKRDCCFHEIMAIPTKNGIKNKCMFVVYLMLCHRQAIFEPKRNYSYNNCLLSGINIFSNCYIRKRPNTKPDALWSDGILLYRTLRLDTACIKQTSFTNKQSEGVASESQKNVALFLSHAENITKWRVPVCLTIISKVLCRGE